MALSTRTIKAKIKSVQNIKKITKAMEMVAASKMRKAVSRAVMTRDYTEAALRLLVNISADTTVRSPFVQEGRGERSLIIMIASNKGLCGGFNVNLARAVNRFVNECGEKDRTDFITIGKNAERAARKMGCTVIGSFIDISENVGISDISGLRKLVIDAFLGGSYRRVLVAYTNYRSAVSYEPMVRVVLPIEIGIEKNILQELGKDSANPPVSIDAEEYMFEPSEEIVLNAMLPRLFEVNIYQALLESFASEQSARMFAMKNASDNAKNLVEDLVLSYNNARQASITREISEIAAGADALQGE